MTIIADEAAITEIARRVGNTIKRHQTTPPETLLNRREVADILSIDVKAVRKLIRFGALGTTIDGRAIPRGAVDKYLNI